MVLAGSCAPRAALLCCGARLSASACSLAQLPQSAASSSLALRTTPSSLCLRQLQRSLPAAPPAHLSLQHQLAAAAPAALSHRLHSPPLFNAGAGITWRADRAPQPTPRVFPGPFAPLARFRCRYWWWFATRACAQGLMRTRRRGTRFILYFIGASAMVWVRLLHDAVAAACCSCCAVRALAAAPFAVHKEIVCSAVAHGGGQWALVLRGMVLQGCKARPRPSDSDSTLAVCAFPFRLPLHFPSLARACHPSIAYTRVCACRTTAYIRPKEPTTTAAVRRCGHGDARGEAL